MMRFPRNPRFCPTRKSAGHFPLAHISRGVCGVRLQRFSDGPKKSHGSAPTGISTVLLLRLENLWARWYLALLTNHGTLFTVHSRTFHSKFYPPQHWSKPCDVFTLINAGSCHTVSGPYHEPSNRQSCSVCNISDTLYTGLSVIVSTKPHIILYPSQ
ncbi:hypothetical protein BJV78DRAFT_1237771 [Lactifluus subvellereus]|nr:hypothetical protein BJV78DRAFT_1237771 [Lactifluus subvellereus]